MIIKDKLFILCCGNIIPDHIVCIHNTLPYMYGMILESVIIHSVIAFSHQMKQLIILLYTGMNVLLYLTHEYNILLLSVLQLIDCTVDLQCDEVCLQDIAQYTCKIDDTTLDWTVPNPMNSGYTDTLTIATFTNGDVTDDTDTFTAVLTNEKDPFVSTLSFETTNQLNNKEIGCESGGNSRTCTITILGV